MTQQWPPPDLVMEQTASSHSGTSDFVVTGAVAGHKTFSSGVTDGRTVRCVARAVDANGIPTGEWELGVYTWTLSGTTLARTTVIDNSAGSAPSKLSFAAATKRIYPVIDSASFSSTAGANKVPTADTSSNQLNASWLDTVSFDGVNIKNQQTPNNLLINGGFDWFQRQNPTSAKAMTDDTYDGPDRWYSMLQGANATIQRIAGSNGSRFTAKMISGGATNRFGVAQIVEGYQCVPMRGQYSTLQFDYRPNLNAGSGTMNLGYAVLEWTGTVDSVTSDVVNTWTSTNYTTGNFFASTSLTLVGTGIIAGTHNTWSANTISLATFSSSLNNIIVIFWKADAPANANDFYELGRVGLYPGLGTQTWTPRPPQQELALCHRYYQKSYPLDTAPGTASVGSYATGIGVATNVIYGNQRLYCPMRVSPTSTNLWAYDGTASKVTRLSGTLTTGGTVSLVNVNQMCGFTGLQDSGTAFVAGTGYFYHYDLDSEL